MSRTETRPIDEKDPLDSLLRRYLEQGDEDAIEAIVSRTRARLVATARRIGAPQDAEDAVQATYLSLIRMQGRSLEAPVWAWLITTVVRIAYRRKAIAQREERIARRLSRPSEAESPERAVVSEDDLALLRREIDRLPARYRDPVVLHHLQGLSTDEVALLLSVPPATVRTRLARARGQLRSRGLAKLFYSVWLLPFLFADRARATTVSMQLAASGAIVGGLMNAKSVGALVVLIAIVGGALTIWKKSEPDEKPAAGLTATAPASAPIEGTTRPVENEPPRPAAAPKPAPEKVLEEPPAEKPVEPESEPKPLFDPARFNSRDFDSNFEFQLAMLEALAFYYPLNWEEVDPSTLVRVGGGAELREPVSVYKGEFTAPIGPDREEIRVKLHTSTVGRAAPTGVDLDVGYHRSDDRLKAVRSVEDLSRAMRSWDDTVGVSYDFRAAQDGESSGRLEAVIAQTEGWLDPELVRRFEFSRDPFPARSYVISRPGTRSLYAAGKQDMEVDEATWSRLERVFERLTSTLPR